MIAAESATEARPAVGQRESFREGFKAWTLNIQAGDIGSLPVVLGILVITIIFQVQNDKFLSAQNLTNLIVQMAPIAFISTGVVFVLLIGEIDLSVGVMSGVGGIIIARLLIPDGNEVPWFVAVFVAAIVAIIVGTIHGLLVTKLGVPSLIVTLATLFIGMGVVLELAGQQGLIRVQDSTVIGIANTFLSPTVSWLVALLAVVAFAATQFAGDNANLVQGLPAQSWAAFGSKVAIAALSAAAVVMVTNKDRGLPLVGLLMGVTVVGWLIVAERTRFGRHIYAVGGNAEAARRAGINVDRVRIACFIIASFMAAFGGLILASRLRSVDNSAGRGDLLLNSIAAAVIGGTSLFGGRGKITSAIQGALVIAAVNSGMGLLGWTSSRKFMVTGAILLLAVTIDSVTRRTRQTSGRA